MKVVIAYRNGEEKLRIPAEIRNGVLRHGQNILINNDLIPAGQIERVKAQIKSGKITPEVEAMGMRIGDNGNGLIVRWYDDVLAESRATAKAEYDALPAEVKAARKERLEIEQLYNRAYKSLNHDTDDNNISRGYSLQAQANARLEAWRTKYSKQAMLEDADKLEAQASKEDDLAIGALVYDADGWISSDEQQRRHDEHKAKAEELRAEAAKLREVANA